MTFLEALNWMSESEENVAAVHDGSKFKIVNGQLYVLISIKRTWEPSHQAFEYLNDLLFYKDKSEPTPEEVEVVAYVTSSGSVHLLEYDSKDEKFIRGSGSRKVKVKFT